MSDKQNSSATEHFNRLIQFRQAAYRHLGRARDAMFELGDAVLATRHTSSLAEFSCSWLFTRRWPSTYEALQDSGIDRFALLQLYCQNIPPLEHLVLAGDHTAWSRPAAWTLADRTIEHQPSPVPGNRPITIGQGYSTLALIPEMEGSWALPLLHERIVSHEKPVMKMSQQLEQVCVQLSQRALGLFDSEYGNALFLKLTAELKLDKVIRLKSNLSLVGPPPPEGEKKRPGPKPKHGQKFRFKDPQTWWEPDHCLEFEDPEFGPIGVQVWKNLHFRQAAECPFWLARIERKQAPGTRRAPKEIWIAWVAEGADQEPFWWQWYGRRYPVEHWYRFAKVRLHWTLPMLATPEQCEHWSDLMPVLTWELWLAREVTPDQPLPWQKPQSHPTPGRVCQGFETIIARIGTPACVPKPRGISPGWPTGKPRRRRQRFAVVKKRQTKPKMPV